MILDRLASNLINTVQWYNFSRNHMCQPSPLCAQETQNVELALLGGEHLVVPLQLLVQAIGAQDWLDDNPFTQELRAHWLLSVHALHAA